MSGVAGRSGGANRKPTVMKIIEGTARADRMNPNEPMPNKVKIAPPPSVELNGPGLMEWERMTLALIELGILTSIDLTQLATYCYYWGEFVDATKIVKKEGPIEKSGKINAAVRVAKEAYEAAHKIAMQYGFTPASRARLNAPKEKPKSALDSI